MTLDPVAALMVDEAGDLTGRVLVLDDTDAALTFAASEAGADVRTWCDDLRDLAAIPAAHRLHVPAADEGADAWRPDLVLWRLPRAVSAVEDYAEHLASHLEPGTRIVAGGRTKHMTVAFNTALARHFASVTASRGRQKSRVLHITGAQPAPRRWPARRYLPEVGITAVAHGSVFHTNRLDDGTRLLLRTLARTAGDPTPDPQHPRGQAIDVGSGSGIIAAWLAQRGWLTTALDVSQAAVTSTRLTAQANHVTVTARAADMLAYTPPASADLVVANPPFHRGAAKDSTATLTMIAQAGQVLRPGGELWLVFNTHLPYLQHLRRHIGITTIEAQDRHYVVARALKEPST
ncbi:MAG: methyltransferase [Propionibacteriaceae bacterium]|nr:methyltransferase [Propionibacteriaceae bacterium]